MDSGLAPPSPRRRGLSDAPRNDMWWRVSRLWRPWPVRPIEQRQLQAFGYPRGLCVKFRAKPVIEQFGAGFVEQRQPALEQFWRDALDGKMFGDRIAPVAAAGEHDGRPEGVHLVKMRLPVARNRARKNGSEFRIEPDLGIERVNQPANAVFGYNVALGSTGNHALSLFDPTGCCELASKLAGFFKTFGDVAQDRRRAGGAIVRVLQHYNREFDRDAPAVFGQAGHR